MIVPSYTLLNAHYPRKERSQLFQDIGWDHLVDTYKNTCAIRMSLCLHGCGVKLGESSGGEKVLKGPHKGKYIEIRQQALSERLSEIFGEPEKFSSKDHISKLAGRDGIASFFGIQGYDIGGQLGGHIDIVDSKVSESKLFGFIFRRRQTFSCGTLCYLNDSKDTWFWPSKIQAS